MANTRIPLTNFLALILNDNAGISLDAKTELEFYIARCPKHEQKLLLPLLNELKMYQPGRWSLKLPTSVPTSVPASELETIKPKPVTHLVRTNAIARCITVDEFLRYPVVHNRGQEHSHFNKLVASFFLRGCVRHLEVANGTAINGACYAALKHLRETNQITATYQVDVLETTYAAGPAADSPAAIMDRAAEHNNDRATNGGTDAQ